MKNLKIRNGFKKDSNFILNKTKKVLAGALVVTALLTPINTKAQTNYYEFGKGDTLWRISNDYYGDPNYWKSLAVWNNIEDPRLIMDGTIISIPDINILLNWTYGEDPTYYQTYYADKIIYYTFQKGDTLWGLCSKYYGDGNYWEMLKEYNGIQDERKILNGTLVLIPELNKLMCWYFGCEIEEEIPFKVDYMYTCGPNDTLWNICKDYYGYGTYYEYLIQYNYDYYGITLEPKKIHNGDILYLPDIEILKQYKNVKTK